MSVSEFAGPLAKQLCKGVANADGSIAILLAGEPGAGQDALSSQLAKAFMCLSRSGGVACGDCKSCVAFDKGLSVDMLDFGPMGKSDWIVFGMINHQDDFERKRKDNKYFKPHVHDFLATGPIQGAAKVVIIHRAERMNDDAANALLKLLEEPPEYARFILTTAAASQLLPTIRSRCALIPCDLPDTEYLTFGERASAGAPELRAHLESEPMAPFMAAFQQWYESLASRSREEALKIGDEFQDLVPLYKEALGKDAEDRLARADIVRLFANLTARDGNSARLARLIEMHGAVQGNVNFSYLCDTLFTSE